MPRSGITRRKFGVIHLLPVITPAAGAGDGRDQGSASERALRGRLLCHATPLGLGVGRPASKKRDRVSYALRAKKQKSPLIKT